MDFNAYVRSVGLDPANLTPELQTALEAAWRASQKQPPEARKDKDGAPTVGGKSDLDDVISQAHAETQRRREVTELVRTYLGKAPDRIDAIEKIGRMAIEGSWTVKDTEHQLLKSCYVQGPLAYVPSSSNAEITQEVLEVSVARAAGLGREMIESSYSDQTLTVADRKFKGGCGLVRLLQIAAEANGVRDAHVSNARGLLRAAFRNAAEDGVAATGFGPSTYSVGGILSNVGNKIVRDAFNGVESVWRQITATRPVGDFKQITSYALTGDLTYQKVGKGGEVKHGTFGEEEYTNQADLYALMLGIDYKDIRNDDLGAFARLMRRLGRGGPLTINTVFWTEFLAGQGSFWAAANGNYLAGTDYAFTLEKLANAAAAWDLRTDPDGQPMADRARFLLVPPALAVPARTYMSSTMISNDGGDGSTNVMAGMFTPLSSVYLANSAITGYSASNYFLVADPQDLPVIETVFLDGQEEPTIETAEPDLNRLGIQMRGMHGFGVTKQEPRGALKLKQTAD
ncbi:MAG: hypothetical protein U0840_25640 [Gemmataceae bacterium]